MKTGFSMIEEPQLDYNYLENVNALLMTLMEKAIINAAFYANKANRDVVLTEDIKIGLMYEAHEFWNDADINEKVQSFKDMSDSDYESNSDDESIEEVNEENIKFTLSTDQDPKIIKMNEYYVNWSSWTPSDPVIISLKNAIDQKF
jgi:hypothetical protein